MSEKSVRATLPPLLESVATAEQWETVRRPQLLTLLTEQEYGRIRGGEKIRITTRLADERHGPDIIGDTVVRKTIEISAEKDGRHLDFPVYGFVPRGAAKPVPAFVCLCNRGIRDADPARAFLSDFIPVETIVARGYACFFVLTHDIAPDVDEGYSIGFHKLMAEENSSRRPDDYGTISAWAWGLSRVMDYIETDPDIDSHRVATVGHSRGGKTSLWTCAQDQRFAMAISSCAGCSGDAITRGKIGEHIDDIVRRFPYWFCENYRRYAGNEDALPFDQHALLAMLAPRPLYISSKTRDDWADPAKQFESCTAVEEVYGLYGLTGIGIREFPPIDTPVDEGCIGFHCRTGDHDMDAYDWERYLDFADRHL